MPSITLDPGVGESMRYAFDHALANPFTDPIRTIATALAEASAAAHSHDRDRLVAAWAAVAGIALAQAQASLTPGVQVFDGYGEPPAPVVPLSPIEEAMRAVATQFWERDS